MAGSFTEEESQTKHEINPSQRDGHHDEQIAPKKSSFVNFFLRRRFSAASLPALHHNHTEPHHHEQNSAAHDENTRQARRRSIAEMGQNFIEKFSSSFKTTEDQFLRSNEMPNPKLSKDLVRHTFPSKKGLLLPVLTDSSPTGSFRLQTLKRNSSLGNINDDAEAAATLDSNDKNLSAQEVLKQCVLSGNLQFSEKKILGSSWTNVFCVLKRSGMLYVYTDQKDVYPRIALDLRLYDMPKMKNSLNISFARKDPVLPQFGRTSSSPGISWTNLQGKKEIYMLRADDPSDKKLWMTRLRTVQRIAAHSSDEECYQAGASRLPSISY
mmetsp:Transcript_3867/g.9567  ORF Transcript_3867/g.9567 Transcript_3867/m.9567 type:complete len:325 (-) Transcript_3867:78-1052(-)